jgi:hypothetical protein
MSPNRYSPERAPTPEQLAAFADGELEPGARERVEGWLTRHPHDAREVESTRRLMSLWRDNPPPEPGADSWAGVLARVAAAVPARPAVPLPARRGSLLPGRVVGSLLAVAAVLGGLLLARPFWPRPPFAPQTPVLSTSESDEPFPVVTAGEVNIIRMDPQDHDAVVLGQPVLGPIEWAAPEDIRVLQVEPHPDGMRPRLEEGPVPMIVAVAGDWEP